MEVIDPVRSPLEARGALPEHPPAPRPAMPYAVDKSYTAAAVSHKVPFHLFRANTTILSSQPHTPIHEFSTRVALHGEGDHHPNTDLLLGIALHPRDFLRVEVRREVFVQHLAFTHGGRRVAVPSLSGRKNDLRC